MTVLGAEHCESARHRTTWVTTGPADGPLMVFLHGWPEIGLLWRRQLEHFGALGLRCVAPDLRGYGGSSVPDTVASYAVAEIVADMVELHDTLGGAPAIWVGHDWGAPIAWGMASHHAHRCRGIVGLSVPYMARGFTLPSLVPLIDRELYPEADDPVGQWDYWLYYRERFSEAARTMESDVAGFLSLLYQPATPDTVGKPAITAGMRARGGWFASRALPPADPAATILTTEEFTSLIDAFAASGFAGPNAWYLQDAANAAFAQDAPDFGRLSLPVLFLHGAWDTVCETARGQLADPMRADCGDLTEATIEAGHMLMIEQPDAVNTAIEGWLRDNHLTNM